MRRDCESEKMEDGETKEKKKKKIYHKGGSLIFHIE